MKTKTSSSDFACEAALWIGDNTHPEMRSLWQVFQNSCDCVSVRPSIRSAIARSTRNDISHVIIAQTNRHDADTLAIETWSRVNENTQLSLSELQTRFPEALFRVIRGRLVAPAIVLVARDTEAGFPQIESIGCDEAIVDLASWLSKSNVDDCCKLYSEQPVLPATDSLIVAAAHYTTAESIFDSVVSDSHARGESIPRLSWTRRVIPDSYRGSATILWDDTVAPPTSVAEWKLRLASAPGCLHYWHTGMASIVEQQNAIDGGISRVIRKPNALPRLSS